MGMKKIEQICDILTYLFLTVLLIIVAFPLIYAVAASFKPVSELFVNADKIFPIKHLHSPFRQISTIFI